MNMERLMMHIDRRTFLKVIGASLGSAAVAATSIDFIFPTEEKPGNKTLAEAVRALVEKEKSVRGRLGFESVEERCSKELLRLIGTFFNKDPGDLWAVTPAFALYFMLDGNLAKLMLNARKLRNTPEVGPLLKALKDALMQGEAGNDPRPIPEAHDTPAYRVTLDSTDGGRAVHIETECWAADWAGINRETAIDRLYGKGKGAEIMAEYKRKVGSVPPKSNIEDYQVDDGDLSWLDDIKV